jgi:nitrate/nitrite transporter NarK
MTLLLYRNTFTSWGPFFPAGLVGLGEVLAAGAVGVLVAAGVTPWVVRHIGQQRWITVLLAGGAVAQLALVLPLPPTTVLAGLLLGFVGQGVKICVDSTLQETVADDHRGRVFSVYDTLVNVTFVGALLVSALLLPPSGISYPLLLAVGAGYLAGAAAYARITRRH